MPDMFGEQQRAGRSGIKSSMVRMLGDEAREVRFALPYRPSERFGHIFCRLFGVEEGQNPSGWFVENSLLQSEGRIRETGSEALSVEARDDAGLDQSRGGDWKSAQILTISKVEIIGFSEGSDMGHGNKRGTKENSKAFGLNIWKDTVPIYETEGLA